jgi:hypothetical protein
LMLAPFACIALAHARRRCRGPVRMPCVGIKCGTERVPDGEQLPRRLGLWSGR